MELQLWPTLLGVYLTGWLITSVSVYRSYQSTEFHVQELARFIQTGKMMGPTLKVIVGFIVCTLWIFYAIRYGIYRFKFWWKHSK